jgi:hypothetical protein
MFVRGDGSFFPLRCRWKINLSSKKVGCCAEGYLVWAVVQGAPIWAAAAWQIRLECLVDRVIGRRVPSTGACGSVLGGWLLGGLFRISSLLLVSRGFRGGVGWTNVARGQLSADGLGTKPLPFFDEVGCRFAADPLARKEPPLLLSTSPS